MIYLLVLHVFLALMQNDFFYHFIAFTDLAYDCVVIHFIKSFVFNFSLMLQFLY